MFFVFLSLFCSPRLCLFDQKYSKNLNIVHIRMISEGSYYTEDWSNDAENSALMS